MELTNEIKARTANMVLPKAGLNSFDWAFVQGSTYVLRLNFCAKNPRLRQYFFRSMDIVSFKESLAANEGNNASWIHAYLHRKEGDIANAGYWYRRAGRKMPDISLEKEWESIVEDLINLE